MLSIKLSLFKVNDIDIKTSSVKQWRHQINSIYHQLLSTIYFWLKKKNKQTNKKTFRYLARNFRITAKLYQKIYHILKWNIYCSFNLKLCGLSKVNEIRTKLEAYFSFLANSMFQYFSNLCCSFSTRWVLCNSHKSDSVNGLLKPVTIKLKKNKEGSCFKFPTTLPLYKIIGLCIKIAEHHVS